MPCPSFTPAENMIYFSIVIENSEKQKEFSHA